MNNGHNTMLKSGFRTRYHITPLDKTSGEPTAPTTTIDNMVLANGYLALGDPTAYTSLSIGTNTLPANPHQSGILSPIAKQNLTDATFSQYISDALGLVFSTCSFEFLFKDFLFPANLKTLDIAEIGLDGVTRAVFDPVSITRNNWVKVIAEIIYEYSPSAPFYVDVANYYYESPLEIVTEAIIYNDKPNNHNGRGWGADRSVLCYPWSGVEGDYVDRSLTSGLGASITPTLVRDEFHWKFDLRINRASADTSIPGLIIRDTVNGGGFLLRFNLGEGTFILPEDGALDLSFKFNWFPLENSQSLS